MTDRPPFQTREFLLRDADIRDRAIAAIRNAPLDPDKPLQLLLRDEVKARKLDQNALMWVGPLADIAKQAWIDGRQYSAEVWHEHFKREFLPEVFDPELCKEKYVKWKTGIKGERLLIGSTTDLTVHGFARYLTEVEAFGASLGVQFHANPRDGRRAA